jgi:hypothetical protein
MIARRWFNYDYAPDVNATLTAKAATLSIFIYATANPNRSRL